MLSRELNSYFRTEKGFLYGHFNWSTRACLTQRICPFLTPECLGSRGLGASSQIPALPPVWHRPPHHCWGGECECCWGSPEDSQHTRDAPWTSCCPSVPGWSRARVYLGGQKCISQAHRVFLMTYVCFLDPLLCIHSLHCGFDIFLFFLDWKSEINDLFSLCSSIWENCFPPPLSLFIPILALFLCFIGILWYKYCVFGAIQAPYVWRFYLGK